jgi:hypothetical protein
MATNYIIERHKLPKSMPVFNRAWCKPVSLMLYGLDERALNLKVCSPDWRRQVDRLIDRLQKEILSFSEPRAGKRLSSIGKIKRARSKLRDLYAIESHCCV